MKYQTRMILYYASITLALSLLLGLVVYNISLRYEDRSRKNSLAVASRQLVSQLEDRFGRMDAIINYILSDSKMLRSITLLGMDSKESVPDTYLADALTELHTGFTTDYIIKNTHRTVFYDQTGYLVSSYAGDVTNQRLNEDFSLENIIYLKEAEEAGGKTVMIGPHKDCWGMYDGAMVYSAMKALQGYRMGFIEVENTIESLRDLSLPEPGMNYVIFINGDEILYKSAEVQEDDKYREELGLIEADEVISDGENLYAATSSELYPLSVLMIESEPVNVPERRTLLFMAVFSTLIVFAIGLSFIIFWSYLLVKPVNELRSIMERTNLDNLSTETEGELTRTGPDEFQALARSYRAMTERVNEAVQNERRSSLLTLQAQFDTLQTQVNPHFIYNVLNIISSRGVMDDDTIICDICSALAEMLRYSTSNKERYALVRQELKYLENYFYLIKARYESGFEYHVEIENAVEEKVIPKMVLQQLVENSLSHGFENSSGIMRVEIIGKVRGSGWEISVRDNGEGFSEEKLGDIKKKLEETRESVLNNAAAIELEIGGMGLINTYARCLLLFSDNLIFDIHNTASGAEVVVGES